MSAESDMIEAMDPSNYPKVSSSPTPSDGGIFSGLFNAFGDIAGSAVKTAIPIIAQDQATRLQNKRDLDYTRALLMQTGSGAKPNDPADALSNAAKTPAERWTANAILYDSTGRPSLIFWLLGGVALVLILKLVFRK